MKPYVYGNLKDNRAAVLVRRKDMRSQIYEVIPGDIYLIPAATKMLIRPDAKIVDDKGNELEATGRYLFTAETIDPYHLVTDMFE